VGVRRSVRADAETEAGQGTAIDPYPILMKLSGDSVSEERESLGGGWSVDRTSLEGILRRGYEPNAQMSWRRVPGGPLVTIYGHVAR
jgi:hypothetical protein